MVPLPNFYQVFTLPLILEMSGFPTAPANLPSPGGHGRFLLWREQRGGGRALQKKDRVGQQSWVKTGSGMQVLEPQHFAHGMLELEGEKRQGVRKEREKVLQWILLGDQSLAGWLRRGTPVGGIRLTLLFQPEAVQ